MGEHKYEALNMNITPYDVLQDDKISIYKKIFFV